MALLLVGLVAVGAQCEPRFRQRACRQFKQYAFRRLTEKGVTSLKKERTARYISGLTNDVTAIEAQWLTQPFNALVQVVSFIGALVLMLLASPVLTAWAVGFTLLPLVQSVVPVPEFGLLVEESALAQIFRNGNLIISIMNRKL